MACPDDNQLVAMLEHPTQFAALEVHMDSCESCRKMVAALATARTLAIGTPGEDAPAGEDLDVVGDRYVIARVLGRGGMGTVYLAKDRTLGREVALKVHRAGSGPKEERAGLRLASGDARLHREALAMAKLAHPNVVTVFEIGSFEDRLYVAMEYVRGGTLRDWVAHGRTWQQTIAMLLEIGAGLAAAHDAWLVLAHRGVLFLDELPESGVTKLEGLRQPLEGCNVALARAAGTLSSPANFTNVGAMNLCPCGYDGDPCRACTCAAGAVSSGSRAEAAKRQGAGSMPSRLPMSAHPRIPPASSLHIPETIAACRPATCATLGPRTTAGTTRGGAWSRPLP